MAGIQHKEIADLAEVSLNDLDCLFRGETTANVANRLNVSRLDVEEFIRGSASAAMTSRLGLNAISAAEELARASGPPGAIGIVIGLLIST
jgi:hypothetical protein